MSQPNPIIVEMSVQSNDVVVPMSVATQYAMPVELKTLEATENGDYDAPSGVAWDRVEVDVSTPSGTVEINSNGIYDVAGYAQADVNVPNSYSASDEGKVVSGGELASQTARTVDANGTYDTTTNDSLTVNVAGRDPYLYENCYSLQLSRAENTWTDAPTITIDCSHLSSLYNLCNGGGTNPGYKKVRVINIPNAPLQLNSAFSAHSLSSAFEIVELDGTLTGANNSQAVFYNNKSLRSVVGGSFDLSAVSNLTNFGKNADKLETVSFVSSSIKVTIDFYHSTSLSDDSLVSIANGLDATASAQTLRLDSTVKARCQTLMGTVADGLFTADASGTVTLADFITATKGWTLA